MLRPPIALTVILIGLVHAAWGSSPERYNWRVLSVKDGDTLAVDLPGLPAPLNPVAVRLRGVDTPESGGRAKCTLERNLAARATGFTRAAIAAARLIEFGAPTWDKYGGRIDAEVWVDGQRLSERLIAAGLARPYDGGKRAGWC
jgi:micrococcal nuclease